MLEEFVAPIAAKRLRSCILGNHLDAFCARLASGGSAGHHDRPCASLGTLSRGCYTTLRGGDAWANSVVSPNGSALRIRALKSRPAGFCPCAIDGVHRTFTRTERSSGLYARPSASGCREGHSGVAPRMHAWT